MMPAPTKHDDDVNDFDLKLFALIERAAMMSQKSTLTRAQQMRWAILSAELRNVRPTVRVMMHPEHVKVTT